MEIIRLSQSLGESSHTQFLGYYRIENSTVCLLSISQVFYPVLSPNDGGDRTYLIILDIVLTPNLHLERLLASLSFSPTILLCSKTALSQVFLTITLFLVPFTLKSNDLHRKSISFLNIYIYIYICIHIYIPALPSNFFTSQILKITLIKTVIGEGEFSNKR